MTVCLLNSRDLGQSALFSSSVAKRFDAHLPFQRSGFSVTGVCEGNCLSDEILDDLQHTLTLLGLTKAEETERQRINAVAAAEREQRNAIIREQDEAYEVEY